jgi:hypothetical protein
MNEKFNLIKNYAACRFYFYLSSRNFCGLAEKESNERLFTFFQGGKLEQAYFYIKMIEQVLYPFQLRTLHMQRFLETPHILQ